MVNVIGSVGTDHHPFPRFLDWMAEAQRELGFDLLVQRGATPERPGVPSIDYMPAADLDLPTTQVRAGKQPGYDPLASVSIMDQLRSATSENRLPSGAPPKPSSR